MRFGVPCDVNLLLLCAAAFVLAPGILEESGARSLGVALGWEYMLSTYSILKDGYSRTPRVPDTSEHLYFVLVNPVVVFPLRRRPVGGPARLGLLRSTFGVLQLVAGRVLLLELHSRFPAENVLKVIPLMALGIIGVFCKHAGLASFQIGMMRALGHPVPERYEAPLLACSPSRFWRRWNTYVGAWAARYVFGPATRFFRRRPTWGAGLASLSAVLVAFLTVGMLHELASFSSKGILTLGWTSFFLLQGTLVTLEETLRSGRRRGRKRVSASWGQALARGVGWSCTSLCLVGSCVALGELQQWVMVDVVGEAGQERL